MTAAAPAKQAAAFGCLVLFMLPFAAVGVFSLVQAVRQAAAGDWGGAAFMGLFGLVFGLVGFGGLIAAAKSRRTIAATEALRSRHPEAPWMWRADWASGRIEDSNRSTMIAAWAFAGLWNLISLPGAYLGLRQALRDETYAALLVLLFPAVGLGLLVWAIRATIRFRSFGVSRLELDTVPARVGRSLRGIVRTTGTLDPREGLRVTLTCVRRMTSGSGKNRSTSERVLWQEEQTVPGRQTRSAEGMITTVPVAFEVPADAAPCDTTSSRDQVVWRLSLSAEVPGVDYAATFEVPVFRTAEGEDLPPSEPAAVPAPVAPFVQPATSRVRVTRNRRGTKIVFPAARNPGASASLTVFLVIWLGAVWAMVHFGAPLFFHLIFGAFGQLLIWGTVGSWLGVSRVTVGGGAVTVASGVLAPTRERRLAAAEIAEVTTRIGMQAGSTPYYDLVLVRTDGKRVNAGRGLRDKREAEWLAATMREALREEPA
jgi:uncharacterized membrane protein HdeD (DUF308 family)